MKTFYFGYNNNKTPKLFPIFLSEAVGTPVGKPYVMVKKGAKWFVLTKKGKLSPIGDKEDHKEYNKLVRNTTWIPFQKNPFDKDK